MDDTPTDNEWRPGRCGTNRDIILMFSDERQTFLLLRSLSWLGMLGHPVRDQVAKVSGHHPEVDSADRSAVAF